MSESIKSDNKVKGNFGEKIVLKYLNKYGYEILDKNFESSYGEIDIIFKDKNYIVFAEIKSRTSVKYGLPAESVTKYKKRHILNTAKYYLYKNEGLKCDVRFDVIEVYFRKNNVPLINHIKNVFW